MAISKTQPMRQAEIALVDTFNEIIQDIPDLENVISDLETTVGDENSGLVKTVNDLDTTINGLETTVGDENSGLVKDVDDLKETVGNNLSGLVKDVDDLENDVFALQNVVGDATDGLVKDVSDIENTISTINSDITTIENATIDGTHSIAAESKNYAFNNSCCFIAVSRGASNSGIMILGYWDTAPTIIGTITDVTISNKTNASRTFTLTNVNNSKGIYLSPNIYEVVE